MSACEKCWSDAGIRAASKMTSKADEYAALIDERAAHQCTPEEQAGRDATLCLGCGRKTAHELTGQCMACGREHGVLPSSSHRPGPGPALEALRLAESALAIKASLRAPEQARVNRALEKVRETLAMYREDGV